MPKLSQAEIKTKADAWALVVKKIDKLDAEKRAELAVFEAIYLLAAREIGDKYEPKLNPLRERAAALETEIIDWLKVHGKPVTLCGKLADAANESKIGNRVIDARKFYDLAKEKFWECVTVGVAKAEKVIGKDKVNEISDKPKTLVSSLTLK